MAKKSAHSGYEKHERPGLSKWAKGKVVEGVFKGWGRGQYKSPIVRFEVEGKTVAYGCPTYLESHLTDLAVGTQVRIECMGKLIGKGGAEKNDPWDFEVYFVPI